MPAETLDDPRFGGVARLYGEAALRRLRRAHVAVFGIGGVGSWCAEALARTGIGALTLVDLDDICITNTNRQVHTDSASVGRPKAHVMAARVSSIAPGCSVTPVPTLLGPASASELLAPAFDVVIDAIDSVDAKCLLLLQCRERNLPLVVSGGAGGKRDPSAVRIADLGEATHDPLLRKMRRILRREHGFPRPGRSWGISCVFSEEPPVFPRAGGTVDFSAEPGHSLRLDCSTGFGSASFVTGTFGFTCAAETVRIILTLPL
ncbi:MAG TPA: tRNA threonylcarbamoyladenosine dehydratase [Verrucomicrobiales bacterium]|nr:tRNA threonylcarbamoyladenosine dehydratase [Verrucomicrobiales bacterium]